MQNRNKSIRDIRKGLNRIKKSGWGLIASFLVSSLVLVVFSYWLETDTSIRCNIYNILHKYIFIGEKGFFISKSIKDAVIAMSGDLLIALEGILGGAVVFFYSVQDSRKDGIPHRTILAYAFGSYTVPIFFFYTWILMFSIALARVMNLELVICMLTVLTILFQGIIIVFILLSTAHKYSIHVIGNAEVRQFNLLTDLANAANEKTTKVRAEDNPFYVWTHLLHHLEQVVVSDELIADKLILVRRIIRVPYYSKEISLFMRYWQRKKNVENPYNIEMDKSRFGYNNLEKVYEFYYENILKIFEQLEHREAKELQQSIILVLYEFMEELTEKYNEIPQKTLHEKKCYLMTISGIMNAIMISNIENSEMVCHYIINNILENAGKETKKVQLGLYFLFQECLFRIKPKAIKIDHLNNINGIGFWNGKSMREEQKLYQQFWIIWMKFTSIETIKSYSYLYSALNTLQNDSTESIPISYIKNTIFNIRKGKRYGYTFDRTSK